MESVKAAASVRKTKKKQVKDEIDRIKQAEKKKRRLKKALATSAAIRSELEKKKQKKKEEQERLDEEGAAIAEAVALHVLLGEDSNDSSKLMLKKDDGLASWDHASSMDIIVGDPSVVDKGKKISSEEIPPSTKRPRSDKETNLSLDSSEKRYRKDSVKKSSSDLFTLELPKALLELDSENSSTFVQSLPTSDDAFTLREYSVEQLERISSQKLVQFLSCHGVMTRKIGSAHNEVLRKELADANQNLDLSIEQVGRLETSCSEKDDQISKRDDQIKKLEEEIRSLKEREQGVRSEAWGEGVRFCLNNFFSSTLGQRFIQDLHQGLIESYQLSKSYLIDMAPHVGYYVQTSFQSAREQAASQGFSGTFDVKKALANLGTSPRFKGDLSMNSDFPWWLKPIQAAVARFEGDINVALTPAPEILYEVRGPSSVPAIDSSSEVLPTLPSIADTHPPLQGDDIAKENPANA